MVLLIRVCHPIWTENFLMFIFSRFYMFFLQKSESLWGLNWFHDSIKTPLFFSSSLGISCLAKPSNLRDLLAKLRPLYSRSQQINCKYLFHFEKTWILCQFSITTFNVKSVRYIIPQSAINSQLSRFQDVTNVF